VKLGRSKSTANHDVGLAAILTCDFIRNAGFKLLPSLRASGEADLLKCYHPCLNPCSADFVLKLAFQVLL
jgi:hypothetical protein